MPHKRKATGLHRVDGEWVNYTLSFTALPKDWPAQEAARNPTPWLNNAPLLHAMRRLAVMADVAASRRLLSLRGQDVEKEQQLRALVEQADKAAMAASRAVQVARAYLTTNRSVPSLIEP